MENLGNPLGRSLSNAFTILMEPSCEMWKKEATWQRVKKKFSLCFCTFKYSEKRRKKIKNLKERWFFHDGNLNKNWISCRVKNVSGNRTSRNFLFPKKGDKSSFSINLLFCKLISVTVFHTKRQKAELDLGNKIDKSDFRFSLSPGWWDPRSRRCSAEPRCRQYPDQWRKPWGEEGNG